MSKTVGSILTIAAAVAVNVIPGVGQFLSATLGATLAAGVTTAATLVGVQTALSLAGSVIFGTPANRSDTTESSRKTPVPPRVRAYGQLRLYGSWALFSFKSNGAPVDVWAFHDGRAHAILQVYLNDDKVTIVGGVVQSLPDKRYRDNKVLAGYNLGAPVETAHAAVVAALPGIWTSDHRGDGVVSGYLIKQLTKSDKFLETYPNGDDIQMSLAGQWTPVFDPRDPAQDVDDPSTWRYDGSPNPGENAILALVHFLITDRGYDYDTQIAPQLAKLTAAIDDCDGAVPLKAGGTEPRYRIAMAYNATEKPSSIIAAILTACDGWFCENERGEVVVYSGRYYEPTVSLGPSQIVSYSLQQHVAEEDGINEVTITYVSREHDYNTVDAQSWRDQAAIDASGREPVTAPLEAQIPSPSQGRRLAKRKMIRANAQFRGTVATTYGGRSVLGERYIHLTIEEAGTVFFDGPAEIVGTPERDMQTGGVRFDWIAADPDIDAWDPSEEEGDATPIGDNPDLEDLDTPIITSATVEGFDIGAQVTLAIDAPSRDDLTWLLRWRITGTTSWTPVEVVDSDLGAPVEIVYGYLPSGSAIDLEVSYTTGDSRSSDWSDTEAVNTPETELDFDGGDANTEVEP